MLKLETIKFRNGKNIFYTSTMNVNTFMEVFKDTLKDSMYGRTNVEVKSELAKSPLVIKVPEGNLPKWSPISLGEDYKGLVNIGILTIDRVDGFELKATKEALTTIMGLKKTDSIQITFMAV